MLTRFEGGVATPWSASGLPKGIKEVLEYWAQTMDAWPARHGREEVEALAGLKGSRGFVRRLAPAPRPWT